MAHKSLGFMQLVIMLGFGLFYANYLLVFFGIFTYFPTDYPFMMRHLGQVAFFVGTILSSLALLAVFSKTGVRALRHTKPVLAASLLLGSCLPACIIADSLGLDLPQVVFFATCLLSGASITFSFTAWEDIAYQGYLKRSVFAHGLVFAGGGILFIIILLMVPPLSQGIMSELLLCASTALIAFVEPRCEQHPPVSLGETREFYRSAWHLGVMIAIISFAFGFAFILLYKSGWILFVIAMSVAIVADFVLTVSIGRERRIPFIVLLRICIASMSVILVALAFGNNLIVRIALCIAIVFWLAFRGLNSGSLIELATRRNFSLPYSAVAGKIPANLGFLIGLLAGTIVFGLSATPCHIGVIAMTTVLLLVICAMTLLPFENYSDAPGYHDLGLEDIEDEAIQAEDFEARCRRIATYYRLSPRESDVLVYVIKGRNAKHIAERLFITESTAKTHIASIYKKMGVHSQQELLDNIEKRQ